MDYLEAFLTAEEDDRKRRRKAKHILFKDEQENVEILFHIIPRRWITGTARQANILTHFPAGQKTNASTHFPAGTRLSAKLRKLSAAPQNGKTYQLWLDPELRRALAAALIQPKWPALPPLQLSQEWLTRIWQQQPVASHLVMILPDMNCEAPTGEPVWKPVTGGTQILESTPPPSLNSAIEPVPKPALESILQFAEHLLQSRYDTRTLPRLNSLILISPDPSAGQSNLLTRPYFAEIYEQTGLLSLCVTEGSEAETLVWNSLAEKADREQFSEASGPHFLCADFRPGYAIPYRKLPPGSIYLDMTSDPEKERLLFAKRKDIHYIGALNFLDTYVRKRYNTCCCKKE